MLAPPAADAEDPTRTEAAKRLQQAEALRVEQERKQATAARHLAAARVLSARLTEQRGQAEAALRAVQHDVGEAEAQLGQAHTDEARTESALKQRAAAFYALVPLMLRMARYPAETVLAIPAPPEQALEGLLVARGLAATLDREAAALSAEESRAAKARTATEQREAALAAQRGRQVEAEAALDKAMAQARSDMSEAQAEGDRAADMVASLASQAQTLRDAIAAMDAARAAAEAKAAREAAAAEKHRQKGAAQMARAREAALARPAMSGGLGRLLAPVAGPVVQGFGAPALDGPTTGLSFGAAPGALVASPCTGRVAFAAPFRSYGQLIILECGGGYDVVMAGLGKMDTAPGRPVRAGEVVGRMGEDQGRKAGERAILYVELRAKGQPVDPAPFLNAKG